MNLAKLSNSKLFHETREARNQERAAITHFLHHLSEVDRRKAYGKLGHSSLHAYCIDELGYDEPSANRRVMAARALKVSKKVETALKTGTVSLTSLAHMQRHIQHQAHNRQKPLNREEKHRLFNEIVGKSTREAEKIILDKDPSYRPRRREQIRQISVSKDVEIRFNASPALKKKIDRLRALYFHKNPAPSFAELLEWAIDTALDKHDPVLRAERRDRKRGKGGAISGIKRRGRQTPNPTSTNGKAIQAETQQAPISDNYDSLLRGSKRGTNGKTGSAPGLKRSRNIPRRIYDEVFRRAGGSCQFVSPVNSKRCNARTGLQVDHRVPFSKGGTHDINNLQLLCWKHNALKGDSGVA